MVKRFSQKEYNNILDLHEARKLNLSQRECEEILIQAGATKGQAKNGAYVYLHHGEHVISTQRLTREEYDKILDDFNAKVRAPKDCINYLESLGASYRQAQSAVYNYRRRHGLVQSKAILSTG
jgi:hypothetical protein